jgi:hypothetical protein
MTRIEEFLTALLNGNTENITPQCRVEQYLLNCVKGCGCDGLPIPKSRLDALLYVLAYKLESGDADALIVFSINGSTYIARKGMTWEEWVNSKYNAEHAYFCNFESGRVENTATRYSVYYLNEDRYGVNVSVVDVIISEKEYFCD